MSKSSPALDVVGLYLAQVSEPLPSPRRFGLDLCGRLDATHISQLTEDWPKFTKLIHSRFVAYPLPPMYEGYSQRVLGVVADELLKLSLIADAPLQLGETISLPSPHWLRSRTFDIPTDAERFVTSYKLRSSWFLKGPILQSGSVAIPALLPLIVGTFLSSLDSQQFKQGAQRSPRQNFRELLQARLRSAICAPATPRNVSLLDSSAATIPVLAYHGICDVDEVGSTPWKVSSAMLGQHLSWLQEQNLRPIGLEDYLSLGALQQSGDSRPVLLTFDDAYKNFMTHALPVLQHFDVPATVFAVTDAVGKGSEWDSSVAPVQALMRWEDLEALPALNISVASHGHNHTPLTRLAPRELVAQLTESRRLLDTRLQQRTRVLAYPYGVVDDVVAECAHQAGFHLAFTASKPLSATRSAFRVPRVTVQSNWSENDFKKAVGQWADEAD